MILLSTFQCQFLWFCFLISFYFFFIGFFGFLFPQKNIIKLLILLELFLIGLNMLYIYLSFVTGTPTGFGISLIILILAGCESGFGLALILLIYRLHGVVSLHNFQYLKA